MEADSVGIHPKELIRPDAGLCSMDHLVRPLSVQARVWNEQGMYRVLEMGGAGHRNDNIAVSDLLRKLADWVESDDGRLPLRSNKSSSLERAAAERE